MKEKNDVGEIRIGYRPVQDCLANCPRSLIKGPQGETEGEQSPKTALHTGLGESIGQRYCRCQGHNQETKDVSKRSQPRTGACGQRHSRESQSDRGRGNKPTVASEQTHPTISLWEPIRDSEYRLGACGLLSSHLRHMRA